MELKIIAKIYNDFDEKFGIPRQSGLLDAMVSKIVFEPEYRDEHVLRGIEEYSHLWLLWQFSEHTQKGWHPTVRPPRLGGNTRVGVFATRSSFRPNAIGMSCVKLERVDFCTKEGPVLYVRGADMLNGTPIIDIKPYLPYVDAYPEAKGGFAEEKKSYCLQVVIEEEAQRQLQAEFTKEQIDALQEILRQDPRPSYQDDENRVYGMKYAGRNVQFRVKEGTVTVLGVVEE